MLLFGCVDKRVWVKAFVCKATRNISMHCKIESSRLFQANVRDTWRSFLYIFNFIVCYPWEMFAFSPKDDGCVMESWQRNRVNSLQPKNEHRTLASIDENRIAFRHFQWNAEVNFVSQYFFLSPFLLMLQLFIVHARTHSLVQPNTRPNRTLLKLYYFS